MTRLLPRLLMLISTAALLTTACSKTEEPDPTLTLSAKTATIPAEGTAQPITITTNQSDWTATRPSADNWCTLTYGAGNTLLIAASELTTITPRTTQVTISAGPLSAVVTVTQSGATPDLTVDKTDVALDIQGSAVTVTVTTNLDAWSASRPEADSWCTVAQSGNTLSISATLCTVPERTTTVTVEAGGDVLTRTIAVTQKGGTLSYEIAVPTDFEESAVKKATYNKEQVAEICLEYIRTSDIDKQLTVIYPVVEGKVDLTRGVETATGGTVVWDAANNTCIYTAGNASNPLTKVWVENGTVKTATQNPVIVTATIVSDLLIDTRGASSEVYRIVKIGTQYWMADNLRAERYRDGSAISTDWTNNTTGAYCYLYNSPTDSKALLGALYNGYAVLNTAGIAPEGWEVPDNAAWTKLRAYIKTPYGTKLKSVNYWRTNKGSGITGFDARPGQAYSTATGFIDTQVETWFWSTNLTYDPLTKKNSQFYARLVDSSTGMTFNADTSFGSFHGQEFGHSIRCLRK